MTLLKAQLIPPASEIRRRVARLNPENRAKVVRQSLTESGLVVARNAQNQMIRGGKGPPHPTKLTSRTGTGRRSITADRRPTRTAVGFFLDVGTPLIYMGLHETGGTVFKVSSKGTAFTQDYPKRAYLVPGFEDSRSQVDQIWQSNLRRMISTA